MRQIIQDLKSGNTILEEVPVPLIKPGSILIRTTRSLVSLGTERMLVEFGKAGYIEKARSEPERVRQVLDKMKTDGILPTLEAVFNKLNQPLPLGYCNVGVVEEVGSGVNGFQVGDRVASNGNHAEYVCVPENLAAKIPENVTDEEACFTVIGSISLQGIRLCNPTFGETIAVAGLGLIGLVTAELLTANGCRVIGYDPDQKKVEIALLKGIKAFNTIGTDPVKFVMQETSGIGTDGVIITASGKSDEIIHQSALMSRKRGRIILVGVVGLNMQRADFYEKELSFQVSCSYGPGRYDENYEQKGHDYPVGYVRWTEKRNFEAILHAISSGQLDVKPLITERIKLEDYGQIYGDMRKPGSIASVLVYPEKTGSPLKTIQVLQKEFKKGDGVFGIIGAGNFTSSTIIPAMKAAGANMKSIASAKGLSAKILAKKGNIAFATSDYKEILNDTEIDTVLISTRHDLHASMVIESLKAGKNVFVEKPLCLSKDDLDEIVKVYSNLTPDISHLTPDTSRLTPLLTVGFNRRFSPLAIKMKVLLGEGPKNIVATMNAGFIPSNSWVHDLQTGGGRIIGEACHFIDLCTFLAGSLVKSVCMNSLGTNPSENTDNASIILRYENGTNAVINYFANGSKSYSKERIEAYNQEKTVIIDNWRRLEGYGTRGFSKMRTKLDKGHRNQFSLLVRSVREGLPIIPFDEIVNTTSATFAAIQSLKENHWIDI